MALTNLYCCKDCGRSFFYDELPQTLASERGESRLERCPDCQIGRRDVRRKMKIGYFPSERAKRPDLFRIQSTSGAIRDRRQLVPEPRSPDSTKMKFGITDQDIAQLYGLLESHRVVVLVSPTGSGKSTYVPYRLITPPENYDGEFVDWLLRNGQIMVTEPLTSAVERIPRVISQNLLGSGLGPGAIIGLRHGSRSGSRRGERYDRRNLIDLVTDGSLRNWIRGGRLKGYSLIMIDEAHQRSINIETILMLVKDALLRYPTLKVIIASATVNKEHFREAFADWGIKAEILDLDHPGKSRNRYFVHFWGEPSPVEGCDCFHCQSVREADKPSVLQPPFRESDISNIAAQYAQQILEQTQTGSILIFLHGQQAIESTTRLLKQQLKRQGISETDIPVLPVYRLLGEDEVARRFEHKGRVRRVLVTTNIAETSHTLDDIDYVIDSGLVKESAWDPDSLIISLPTIRHSQSGCKQRWGRVGRVRNGYVYCLYTREQYNSFSADTEPEAVRSSLDDMMLTLAAAGLTESEDVSWIIQPGDFDTPEQAERWQRERQRSVNVLKQNRLVDAGGVVSERAQDIFRLPHSAELLDLLSVAEESGCVYETMIACYLIETRDHEPRTGDHLYGPTGLFYWDSNWDAATQMHIGGLHRGLRFACRDDLDLVAKIADRCLTLEPLGCLAEWTRYYGLNHQVLEQVFAELDLLFTDHYRVKAKKEERRGFDIDRLNRVRRVMYRMWPARVVQLKDGNYKIGKTRGCISSNSVVFGRTPSLALVASSSNRLGSEIQPSTDTNQGCFLVLPPVEETARDLFNDLWYPFGSTVEWSHQGDQTVLGRVIRREATNLHRQRQLGMPSVEEEAVEIQFDPRFLADLPESPEVIAIIPEPVSETEVLRICGWIRESGYLTAVLEPAEPIRLLEEYHIEISQVFHDPWGSGGVAVGVSDEGYRLPVDLSALMLHPAGYGAEHLIGRSLAVASSGVRLGRYPVLSGLAGVFEDLIEIHRLIEVSEATTRDSRRQYIELAGSIVRLDYDTRRVIVILDERPVLHTFEISEEYVPGKDLAKLKVGERVNLRLLHNLGQDQISIDLFDAAGREVLPEGWFVDQSRGCVLIPFCLTPDVMTNWNARDELKTFILRHSWLYSITARIRPLIYKAEATIPLEKIGILIGRGGDTIRQIADRTNAQVNIDRLRGVVAVIAESERERDLICCRIDRKMIYGMGAWKREVI